MFYKTIVSLSLCFSTASFVYADQVADAPNGIHFPSDYRNWKTIAVSHRIDNHSIRTILGNDIAVKAAEEGKTNPWPEGTILGKVVWKEKVDADWNQAIVPGEFVHAEFMVKDNKKYQTTNGWGYARWVGKELKPYGGNDANIVNECVACHTPVQNNDWVYTHPAYFPHP